LKNTFFSRASFGQIILGETSAHHKKEKKWIPYFQKKYNLSAKRVWM